MPFTGLSFLRGAQVSSQRACKLLEGKALFLSLWNDLHNDYL